jgi:hypothetical protein
MLYLSARLNVTGFVSWVSISEGTFTIDLQQDQVMRNQPRSFVIVQAFMPRCKSPGHMPLPSTLVSLTGEVLSVMAGVLAVSVDNLITSSW